MHVEGYVPFPGLSLYILGMQTQYHTHFEYIIYVNIYVYFFPAQSQALKLHIYSWMKIARVFLMQERKRERLYFH